MIKSVQFFVWLFGRALWLLIFRLEVKHRRFFREYPARNIVFFSNHMSYFDAFLVSTNIPFRYYLEFKGFRFLTKTHQALGRWYSPFIRAMGSYPIPQDKKGYKQVLPETIRHVKDGWSVVIFPIPKLNVEIDPAQARPGLAYLAEKTGATLAPVHIGNTYGWKPGEFFGRHRRVTVTYGRPIGHGELSRLQGDYRERSRQLMEVVAELGREKGGEG